MCDQVIYVIDIVLTNVTNTVAKDMTRFVPTNVMSTFDDRKVRYKIDCYILHTVS